MDDGQPYRTRPELLGQAAGSSAMQSNGRVEHDGSCRLKVALCQNVGVILVVHETCLTAAHFERAANAAVKVSSATRVRGGEICRPVK
jgi:hypothetical protein